ISDLRVSMSLRGVIKPGIKSTIQTALSPAIYAALVDSLFQNATSMFLGTLSGALAALMTAVKTGDPWLWPCTGLILATAVFRSVQMHQYERRRTGLTGEDASPWEIKYAFGSILQAIALGAWCFITLYRSDDTVAHLLCTASTVGYTAAGAARNYGRPWLLRLHMFCACGPMVVGLLLTGNRYYVAFALLIVLFYIGLRQINNSLNQIFTNLLTSRERESALASQFDTALNNMPHGLCMFGSDGHLVVINERFVEMMGLDAVHATGETTVRGITSACVADSQLSRP